MSLVSAHGICSWCGLAVPGMRKLAKSQVKDLSVCQCDLTNLGLQSPFWSLVPSSNISPLVLITCRGHTSRHRWRRSGRRAGKTSLHCSAISLEPIVLSKYFFRSDFKNQAQNINSSCLHVNTNPSALSGHA